MKLITIEPSPRAGKKWRAVFDDAGKRKHTEVSGKSPTLHPPYIKVVDFGASGMEDYTIHKDAERRERYLSRHRHDLETNDPTRAGYLSYYILWGPTTSFNENVRLYKNKFHV